MHIRSILIPSLAFVSILAYAEVGLSSDPLDGWTVFASVGNGVNVLLVEQYGSLRSDVSGTDTFQIGFGHSFRFESWGFGQLQGSWLHAAGERVVSDDSDVWLPLDETFKKADDLAHLQGILLFRIGRETHQIWSIGPTLGYVRGEDALIESGSLSIGGRAMVTFDQQRFSWSTGLDYLLLEARVPDDRLRFISVFAAITF